MQLKYDELSSGRYEVRCDEKLLEHVLFADEEEGYCLLGATDLQGNLLPAADPDAGYPYETVRVKGAVQIAHQLPLRESSTLVHLDGTPFNGGTVLVDPEAGLFSVPVTIKSFAPEQLFPTPELFFSNLDPLRGLSAPPIQLRTFGLKLELTDIDWVAFPGCEPPVLPPPVPHPAAERVDRLLRLRTVPGHPARLTLCFDWDEGELQEYVLDEHRVFDDNLQLKLAPIGPGGAAQTRYFLIRNPQTDLQLRREHFPGGPPLYDPGTGCMVPVPAGFDSQLTLQFSPGVFVGPLTGYEHWKLLEGLLDSLIESGRHEGEDEEEEDEGDDPDTT